MIPSTQAVAWSEVLKRLPKSEQIVADYVKFNPGQDRNEIDRGLSDRPNAGHSRRLARLERKGVLRRGPAHISSVTGHLCDTWFATGDPPRWVPIPVPAHKRLTRLCQPPSNRSTHTHHPTPRSVHDGVPC